MAVLRRQLQIVVIIIIIIIIIMRGPSTAWQPFHFPAFCFSCRCY